MDYGMVVILGETLYKEDIGKNDRNLGRICVILDNK